MRFSKKIAAAVGTAAMALSALVGTAPMASAAQTTLPVSPEGQQMIVSANVEEFLNYHDNAEQRDLGNFARYLADSLPYEPDVLSIQETRLSTAKNLVSRLNAYGPSGHYKLVAFPADVLCMTQDPCLRHSNSIIINTDTVDLTWPEHYIKLPQGKAAVPDGAKQIINEVPYIRARERNASDSTELETDVVAVHLRPKKGIVSPNWYHAHWMDLIMDAMDTDFKYGGSVPVLAGDMNNYLCENNTPADSGYCTPTSLWDEVKNHVNDSGTNMAGQYTTAQQTGIDHIFTHGQILRAYKDPYKNSRITGMSFADCMALFDAGNGFESPDGCNDTFYSDHAFTWAVIGDRP